MIRLKFNAFTKGMLLAVVCTTSGLFYSCNKNSTAVEPSANMQLLTDQMNVDSNFVSNDVAKLIAERIPENYFENSDKSYLKDNNLRDIENSFSLQFDGEAIPAVYIFNYKNSRGYAIISADFRYEPILALGDNGNLKQGDSLAAGMHEWLMHNIENIELVREGMFHDTSNVDASYTSWSGMMNTMGLQSCCLSPEQWTPAPYNPCESADVVEIDSKLPLTTTKWGQGNNPLFYYLSDFNLLINNSVLNCAVRPLAGCVPIATAQILKYWSKANPNYNYASMSNTLGTTASQQLIADLLQPGQLDANTGCFETSALNTNVPLVLKNVYGYTSGGTYNLYSNTERWEIKNNLESNRVVYVSGANTLVPSKKCWFFKGKDQYKDYHAWLIDGYSLNQIGCYNKFWFHMNWGYYGKNNDWFYEGNWQYNASQNYQYQRTLIKNIYP